MSPDDRMNFEALRRQHERACSALRDCLHELFPEGTPMRWVIHGEPGSGIAASIASTWVIATDEFGNVVEVPASSIVTTA